MFFKLFKLLPAWRSITWLSLVAFLLGGTPRVGCVCADGQFRFFCTQSTSTPRCSCCGGAGKSPGRSCCASRHQPASGGQRDATIQAPQCCHPAIAAISVVEKNKESESSRPGASTHEWFAAEALAALACPPAATCQSPDWIRQPPADLVISLQRLTI